MPDDNEIRKLTGNELLASEKNLVQHIAGVTGEDLSPELMPGELPESWPAEVRSLFRQYLAVEGELARRNSMRCVREVTRFKKELDCEQPLSDEVRRWRLDRY